MTMTPESIANMQPPTAAGHLDLLSLVSAESCIRFFFNQDSG